MSEIKKAMDEVMDEVIGMVESALASPDAPADVPAATDATDSTSPTPEPAKEKYDGRAALEKQIGEQQILVADLAIDELKKKSLHKGAKERHEAAVEELLQMENDLHAGRYPLPFRGDSSGLTDIVAEDPLPGQQELPLDGPAAVTCNDAWRAVSICELGQAGAVNEKLINAGLKTLGELADYTAADKLLTDIKGIGQTKADKIGDALAEYWRRNPVGGSTPEDTL